MKIYVRDEEKEMLLNIIRTSEAEYEEEIKVKSLDQHDLEIRAEERKKVIAELEEWYMTAEARTTEQETWDMLQELKQKLNEMKGEK